MMGLASGAHLRVYQISSGQKDRLIDQLRRWCSVIKLSIVKVPALVCKPVLCIQIRS